MALTIAELLNLGKGRAEYIYHTAGFPHCVHTGGLDWSGVSLAMRRVMFGTHTYAAGVSKFANTVDAYPYLQRPGACTVTAKDGAAVLTGGNWSAKIEAQLANVTANPFNYRSHIQGLEGLQAISSVDNDHTIGWGMLSESFSKSDTTLNVKGDVGNRLRDAITAAAGDPYLLWIGGECMAASAVANDGDEIDITIPPGWRGLYLSVEQGHYIDKLNTPVYVADSPLNGYTGRPANLWMVIVDSDGTPIASPVMIRTGKIEKIPSLSSGMWTVGVLPWWSWLDYEMDLSDVPGMLDGYVFSRAPATTGHPPHMQIAESTDLGSNWSEWADVWLCAADSTVRFDTLAELYDGTASACTTASTALNSWNYNCGGNGPYVNEGSTSMIKMRGPLPAILRWGTSYAAHNWDDCQEMVNGYKLSTNPWGNTWWDYSARGLLIQYGDEGTPVPYIYQMHRNSNTDYDEDEGYSMNVTWPPSLTSGSPELHVKDADSISGLDAGDIFNVGTDQFIMQGGYFEPRSTLAWSKVGSISGNVITLNVDTADEHIGLECLVGKQSDTDPPSDAKFTDGMYLYYRPSHMETDPWPIEGANDFGSIKLSSIFKALFGDSTDFALSGRIQADHIPWSYDHGNWSSFIDWDTLDELADELGSMGLSYSYRYTGKINLWKEFQNCLRFLGLSPTYEWDATDSHYKIRFRRVGTINATIAQMSGRVINQDTISEKTTIAENIDVAPLYNTINLKVNWDSAEQKFIREDTIIGHTTSTTGGKSVAMDIATRFIKIDDSDESNWLDLMYHFGNILRRTMPAGPTKKFSATIKDKFAHGVGVEILVTADNTYDSFTGVPGLDEYPALITSMSVDLDKCAVNYTIRTSPGIDYGWGPSCIVLAGDSTVVDADTIRVTDISDNATGRNFCNISPTFGWYDHWFFGNLKYNNTMSEPATIVGAADKQVIVVELNDITPTIYTGLTITNVDKRDYATITGAGDPFFEIEGAHVGYNTAKDHVIFYANRDTVGLTTAQNRWVYIANSSLVLQDSDANTYTGNFWK